MCNALSFACLSIVVVLTVMVSSQTTTRYTNIVLEGGGLKGMAYIGAAKAFADTGYYVHNRYAFTNITGTSIGCLFGYALALDVSPWDLEKLVMGTNISTLLDDNTHALVDFPRYRDENENEDGFGFVTIYRRMRYLFRLVLYVSRMKAVWAQDGSPGISRGHSILLWIMRNLTSLSPYSERLRVDSTMLDLKEITGHDLTCIATRLARPHVARFNAEITPHAKIHDAIYASIAVPFVFKPLNDDNGNILVDGGLIRNFAIYEYDYNGVKSPTTLGLSLHGEYDEEDEIERRRTRRDSPSRFARITDTRFTRKLLDVIFNEKSYMDYASDARNCDRVVFLDSRLRWFDFDVSDEDVQRDIARAYSKTRDHLINSNACRRNEDTWIGKWL